MTSSPSASTFVVVTDPADWPVEIDDVTVVPAKDYLTDPALAGGRRGRVVNLCRSYRYQRSGYYVSLLGHARGHRPTPPLATIQDAKSRTVQRMLAEELQPDIDTSLVAEQGRSVVLTIYFGTESLGRHPALAKALFARLPLPLMRAELTREETGQPWRLRSCRPVAPNDIPPEQWPKVRDALKTFLRRRTKVTRREVGRYDMAILIDPRDEEPPSNEGAIRRFVAAGEAEGFAVELVDRHDYGRVAEFDALFIRETTAVNHRTFRFAQRAAAEGLVVIDDPESILRCTNKVFLAEALARADVPTPPTHVLHRSAAARGLEPFGLPCVLKQPDSSFSQGVVRADDHDGYVAAAARLFRSSDLIVVQPFMPTEFDWRIGVLGGKPLYACKYFMARRHWQIIRRGEATEKNEDGEVEAVAIEHVPAAVLKAALRAAALMGDGLYGVDLKEVESGPVVIEVNDNPSIDAGYEDLLLGDGLYRAIMADFRRRLDARVRG